ncbi:MAG TPA: phosphoadenosine phosphosulfate reductase family protein, partial [Steroidobacteraceae bacterium]|nr:phosphoadenosine phosphosulfate reductase family protein [Steroidobacteraceae bacterium]
MRALAWNPEHAMHEPAVLDEINGDLERRSAEDRVSWALEHLPGEHAVSSSFGAQAAVSLHMVTRQKPSVPVVLVDTGYLFPETYRFVDD